MARNNDRADDPAPQLVPPPSARPVFHGRAALELQAYRSVTSFGVPEVEADRSFATPSLRVEATAEDVGGFRLRTAFRLAYRYSDPTLGSPVLSARVHHAALERTFTAVPLRLVLGRFHSPVDAFGGFWDGALVRLGSPALGGGALVGFQPDRWNERPSIERPKGSVFLDSDRRGTGWSWRGALSAHTATLGEDASMQGWFLGLEQMGSWGRLRLAQQLRVDRSPLDGQWNLGWVEARGSLRLHRGVDLTVGASRRERDPWSESWRLFQSLHRDRLHAGVALRVARASVGATLSTSRDYQGEPSTGYTGSVVLPLAALPGSPLVAATASRWTGERGDALSASPSLSIDLARIRMRLGYRFYRFSDLGRESTMQGADLSTDLPLGKGLHTSLVLRKQWGGSLRSEMLYLSLARSF